MSLGSLVSLKRVEYCTKHIGIWGFNRQWKWWRRIMVGGEKQFFKRYFYFSLGKIQNITVKAKKNHKEIQKHWAKIKRLQFCTTPPPKKKKIDHPPKNRKVVGKCMTSRGPNTFCDGPETSIEKTTNIMFDIVLLWYDEMSFKSLPDNLRGLNASKRIFASLHAKLFVFISLVWLESNKVGKSGTEGNTCRWLTVWCVMKIMMTMMALTNILTMGKRRNSKIESKYCLLSVAKLKPGSEEGETIFHQMQCCCSRIEWCLWKSVMRRR